LYIPMTILRIRLVVLAISVSMSALSLVHLPSRSTRPSFGRVLNSAGGATEHSCLAVVLAHCENSVRLRAADPPPFGAQRSRAVYRSESFKFRRQSSPSTAETQYSVLSRSDQSTHRKESPDPPLERQRLGERLRRGGAGGAHVRGQWPAAEGGGGGYDKRRRSFT